MTLPDAGLDKVVTVKRREEMTESQRKWLEGLQGKGAIFEHQSVFGEWEVRVWSFKGDVSHYRIPAQTVPDIPEWREICWDMQSKGVKFKFLWGSMWENADADINFTKERDRYRIPQQPLPEWKEEMTEETKPEPPEPPNRDLQIQWHKDKIHSLETGEPMREWDYMEINKKGEDIGWYVLGEKPIWLDYHKYRRKPRTVKYWHCVGVYTEQGKKDTAYLISGNRKDLEGEIMRYAKMCKNAAKFSPITETTAELED